MQINFKNVSFYTSKEILLNNVSFSIEDNTIVGIVGNSKSGKTVIGDLLCSNIKPTVGKVENKSFISFISSRINDELKHVTVREELESVGPSKVVDSLMMVGLNESYLDKKISDLLFNEKKKLILAKALLLNPKTIVMDEPSVGLNNKEKKDLLRLIKVMKTKYNKTIVLLTKDTDFIYGVVDNVILLDSGNLIYSGKEVLENEEFLRKYKIKVPYLVEFVNIFNKKGFNLKYYTDIRDLIKIIYRSVR